VDYNGKQALNFQISLFLYAVVLGAISIPFFLGFLPGLLDGGIFNWHELHHHFDLNLNFDSKYLNLSRLIWPVGIAGLFQAALFIINIVYTILATLRTNEGQHFSYPISIKFIK